MTNVNPYRSPAQLVAEACSENQIALLIPCHRALRTLGVVDGIVGEVMYPSLNMFSFAGLDTDVAHAVFAKHNDYIVDYCSVAPVAGMWSASGGYVDGYQRVQQATWSSGDFSIIGTTLQIVGEQLCETVAAQRVAFGTSGHRGSSPARMLTWIEGISSRGVPSKGFRLVGPAAEQRRPLALELFSPSRAMLACARRRISSLMKAA